MKTLWALVQDNEYVLAKLYQDYDLFPKVTSNLKWQYFNIKEMLLILIMVITYRRYAHIFIFLNKMNVLHFNLATWLRLRKPK